MADVMSIIAANYKTVGMTVPSKTPYVAVDPALYEGNWTGKYADNKMFKITVSNVTGFRAKVQYQSDGTKIPSSRSPGGTRRWSRTSSPTPRPDRPFSTRPTRNTAPKTRH
jgi:hypothetical protein